MLQLFPYGWDLPDSSVIREQVYSGMAEAINATYFRWVNPDVSLAYFRRCGHACRSRVPSAVSGCCGQHVACAKYSTGCLRALTAHHVPALSISQ